MRISKRYRRVAHELERNLALQKSKNKSVSDLGSCAKIFLIGISYSIIASRNGQPNRMFHLKPLEVSKFR